LRYRSTFLQLGHVHYVMAIVSLASDGVNLVNPIADNYNQVLQWKNLFQVFSLLPEVEVCQEQLSWLESEGPTLVIH